MATMGNNNMQAKLVLLGDMGAGKSSLVLRFVKGQFFDYQESTIGAAFFSQTLAVNETTVKFEIWDTAGQERYHSLAPMYYRGAAAAIIVYDITNADSFARAKNWVQELLKQGNPNLVMALAGNKADVVAKRKVEPEEAETYAKENGLFFMETSAKTAQNVNELFYEIARRLPKAQPNKKHMLRLRDHSQNVVFCMHLSDNYFLASYRSKYTLACGDLVIRLFDLNKNDLEILLVKLLMLMSDKEDIPHSMIVVSNCSLPLMDDAPKDIASKYFKAYSELMTGSQIVAEETN
ncbi:hypothetical protein SUGI_0547280 [Cryptomeria japonica]|nr:hypothetical protein SUGI_0547280 [Cryptomeria japonica]